MYRLGLSRQRIAALVRVHPAAVGYHLVIARRQDPGLEAAHQAATVTKTGPSPGSLARMDEITAWIRSEGRLPRDRSEHQEERSMARWLSERRREAADGTLSPAYRDGVCDRLSVGRFSQELEPSWWLVSGQKSGKNQAGFFFPKSWFRGLAWR
jgi:hypothetical protein